MNSRKDAMLAKTHQQLLREIIVAVRETASMPRTMRIPEPKVLFVGLDGKAKTLAAEVLARELSRDLYRVELNSIVSKYIGETEKNLRRVFENAASNNAVLFFDEAGALFGKRSDVKDSHDRFANLEVGYLLQRLEEHFGILILSANSKGNIDEAFLRRIGLVIEFEPVC